MQITDLPDKEKKHSPPCRPGPAGAGRFVTGISVFVIAAGGFLTFSFARANYTLAGMISSPGFQLSMSNATLPVDIAPAARILAGHPREFFFFSLLFWLSITILGVGVLKRKKWGRSGLAAVLYLGAAVSLILLLFPEIVVPRPLMRGGRDLSPQFNAVVKTLRIWFQLFCALGTGTFFWLARKLESETVRREFGP